MRQSRILSEKEADIKSVSYSIIELKKNYIQYAHIILYKLLIHHLSMFGHV